jgi:hypothetical protein
MNHVNDVNGGLTIVSDQQEAAVRSAYTIRKSHVARDKAKLKLHGSNATQGAHGHQFPFWATHSASCNVLAAQTHAILSHKK